MNENYYHDFSAARTGLRGRCPRCARGHLFDGYLTVAEKCKVCGLSFSFADAGDGATYFVLLFACVVGVGSIFGIEAAFSPPIWVHVVVALVLIVIAPLLMLRPVKGLFLAHQWKTNAHEGRH